MNNSAAAIVRPYTVRQLNGTDGVPTYMQDGVANLTTMDRNNLLASDPWASSSNPVLDTNRFQKVITHAQAYGPADANPNTPEYPWMQSVSYNSQNDSTNGTQVFNQDTVLFTTGFNFFGLFGADVKIGPVFQVQYTDTRTHSTGNQQTASVTLSTSNVQCSFIVDLYLDAIFGSYAPVATSYTSGCRP